MSSLIFLFYKKCEPKFIHHIRHYFLFGIEIDLFQPTGTDPSKRSDGQTQTGIRESQGDCEVGTEPRALGKTQGAGETQGTGSQRKGER